MCFLIFVQGVPDFDSVEGTGWNSQAPVWPGVPVWGRTESRIFAVCCHVGSLQFNITSKIDSFSLQSTRENQARIHFTEEHGTCTFIVHMYHHFHRILITIYLYTILWTLVIEPIYIDIQLYVHLLFISVIIYKLNRLWYTGSYKLI